MSKENSQSVNCNCYLHSFVNIVSLFLLTTCYAYMHCVKQNKIGEIVLRNVARLRTAKRQCAYLPAVFYSIGMYSNTQHQIGVMQLFFSKLN